ncbi:AAA family ATPase [Arthrobacter sp. R-11]|uniref:AAA family ATPase n=1 Tax=Arthrobacter sp. R-11 TaxID=3404053 RepID=UPI003CF763AB
MNRTGSTETRLIVIRGNSGSGKSQLAHAIRAARPRGVAIIGHDVLRREILHVRDHPGALSVPLIDMTTRFALDNGLHVVLEGILHSESYGKMLANLCRDHLRITRCYYYNLELPETLRRHRTKKLAGEVSEEQVASWYRSEDLVAGLDEAVFDETISVEAALNVVLNDVGWQDRDVS